jgi:hypothetical protein
MTNEQINIAIAKACGWAHPSVQPYAFPDYCNDLNAIHEAEKTLTADQFEQYRWVLWDMCKQLTVKEWYRAHLSATARQRAEALLKTLEKWEEQ